MDKITKSVTFKMRLTEEEYDELKSQSERTGLTMSSIIRSAWKNLKVIELPSPDLRETLIQLRRAGNNLNQLTRAANEGNIFVPEIKTTLSDLTALDRRISKLIAGGEA